MARLAIHLLGSFRVTRGDRVVTGFESDKVPTLLAYLDVEERQRYLHVTQRPHSPRGDSTYYPHLGSADE